MSDTTNNEAAAGPGAPFTPKWPTLAATGVMAVWVSILSLPMLSGRFVASNLGYNDQYASGYAFRSWGAYWWKELGHVPQWNPELFGGLPFVGAMHGDIFYPTAWLRLLLPTHHAMNLGFYVHYVLAGLFTYLLLRAFRVSWLGAVVAGLAYQLSGVIGSYVSPGHDGKLFVTALLPLGLLALTRAIRDARWEGYGAFALVVGLAIISPQAQMAQYFLITSGLFSLYLVFGTDSRPSIVHVAGRLGAAFGAVVVGFGIAAVQLVPFYRYIPYSPRGEGALQGFEWSVSYAIPWSHVPEFFFSGFVGALGTYWGANPIKLHSEYLGLSVVALVGLGMFNRERRRLVYWLGGIGLLFLLVALGGATPFYRLWWELVPFVKATRAPGMALYVVSLMLAAIAAFGVERLERREGKGHAVGWVVGGVMVVLFALAGVFGNWAEDIAQRTNLDQTGIRDGAIGSGLALLALGGVGLAWFHGSMKHRWVLVAVAVIVGTDLWWNARPFWHFSRPQDELFGGDQVTALLSEQPRPFRVFNYPQATGYDGSSLMGYNIAELLGYHGNELHAFDELLGGKNVWRHGGNPQIWDLYAVNYFIAPEGQGAELPGFEPLLTDVRLAGGQTASLLAASNPAPYARVVGAAAKVAPEQIIPTVVDQRFPTDQVVLLEPDAPVDPIPFEGLPAAPGVEADVTGWQPGAMTVTLSSPAPAGSYLLVAENHYPDWTAAVNGDSRAVLRGNGALLTVALDEGDQSVTLRFESSDYLLGKWISVISVGLAGLAVAGPVVRRRRGV